MAGTRPRILIVDTARAARLVAELLGDQFEKLCAHTWDEAVQLLQRKRPQAVLVGYHFDEMRPYRFVRHLREDPLAQDVPVVVVRGLPLFRALEREHDVRDAYRRFGADDYIAIDKTASGPAFGAASAQLLAVVNGLLDRETARSAR